jgi:hypothetical protein
MALCQDCLGRLLPNGRCGRCDRKLWRDFDNARAEEDAIARHDTARPAVSVAVRVCEVCLQPSSFSPCTRCEQGDLGLLGQGDQPW